MVNRYKHAFDAAAKVRAQAMNPRACDRSLTASTIALLPV
jgi:hypothetical protein